MNNDISSYSLAAWLVAALLLVLLARNRNLVYWGAFGLAAIPVYFRQRNGDYLPMLGAVHMLSMGVIALVMYLVVERVRRK
jgi:hypothetical protein